MLTCSDLSSKNCALDPTKNCGSWTSYPYFFTFVLLCSYLMTNLFLAVIMDKFVYLTRDCSILDTKHIPRFTKSWKRFDRDATGQIPAESMIDLLKHLNPAIGLGAKCPRRRICSKLIQIRAPITEENTVHFRDLFLCLVLSRIEVSASNEEIRDELEMLVPKADEDMLDRILPAYDDRIPTAAEKAFYEECAAKVISGYVRIYRKRTRASKRRRTKENGVDKNIQNKTKVSIANANLDKISMSDCSINQNMNSPV